MSEQKSSTSTPQENNASEETAMQEIEFLKGEVDRLRKRVGHWRRLAQEKAPRKECIREGWSTAFDGRHYKVYAVQDIPGDLPIREVIQTLDQEFLPSVAPYELQRVDYSNKYKGWLVQVETPMFIEIENEVTPRVVFDKPLKHYLRGRFK